MRYDESVIVQFSNEIKSYSLEFGRHSSSNNIYRDFVYEVYKVTGNEDFTIVRPPAHLIIKFINIYTKEKSNDSEQRILELIETAKKASVSSDSEGFRFLTIRHTGSYNTKFVFKYWAYSKRHNAHCITLSIESELLGDLRNIHGNIIEADEDYPEYDDFSF